MLPGHHLSTDAKGRVRLGTGLIGTIAALVLGLLIAAAKNSYDTQTTQIKQMTANIVLLDNLLVQYGPEADAARNLMRRGIVVLADRMWRENSSDLAKTGPFEASGEAEAFYIKLQELSPRNDAQRSLQARAIQISTDVAQNASLLRRSARKQIFIIEVVPVETLLNGMDHQTMQGPSSKSLYILFGIAGALVGARIADAVDFDFLGFGPAIAAVLGAAFFVIGWRQLQPP
jgi:uncharacterized membrane protein YeaQ/YmgE (transglycosylase-associated protein family)